MFTNNDTNVTENRNIYVGGSDVPTLLGLNKYKNVYQLTREKLGLDPSDFKGNEYTEFGNILEPQIRDYINAVNELEFYPTTTIDEKRAIRGNCDGLEGTHNLLLEIKTHGKNLDIRTYIPQMQLYMHVFNLHEGWLALYERPEDFDVEFDADRLKIRRIQKDDEYIDIILAAIENFWKGLEWLKDHPGASEDDFNNRNNVSTTTTGGGNVNELQVKTIKFQPAVVEFNYTELEAALESNLKKYNGLTFTEDTAADCKNSIAELRKGKKAVDAYRLQTKKQLTASVTEFENQCKALNQKFDEVIDPLVKQSDSFEDKRREEKRDKILAIAIEIIKKHGLNQKHAADLIIEDSYLVKSKSLKSIESELNTLASHLKMKQDKRASDEEIIKGHVQLVNAQNELNLIESTYINLLDYQEFQSVKERIDSDVQQVLDQREKERLAQEAAKTVAPTLPVQSVTQEGPTVEPEQDEAVYFEVFRVVGTESQLNALEDFMNAEKIEFTTIKEDE